MKFTHLHTHSHYSLLDGMAKIDELVAKAKELNMEALAITDHGVMYGVIEFYQKCKKAGIKPIIGVEFYLAPNGIYEKQAKMDEDRYYHLVLLAKDQTGYKNLIELTTIAHLEGFYYKPRVDWALIKKHHNGLIALSACLGGEIPTLIKNGHPDKAEVRIKEYQALFGPGNFYLELQHHKGLAIQEKVNDMLIEFGKKMDIPVVATNDIHYVNYEDRSSHDVLLCLQTKKFITDTDRMSMMEFDVSFRSPEQMMKDFSHVPEAIENTQKIADMCNLEIELGQTKLPYYELPEGETAENYVYKLCVQGLKKRFDIDLEKKEEDPKKSEFKAQVLQRMEYELSVINKMGFAPYFLIVQDFVNWSKNNGVVVGPGRGSAAGALVTYLLNITNVDPLKYDLLFERFLNPERISMPDIDIDFADTKREDVIRYVEGKYGKDHVAQIITFGTMAARAAIKDVGRVLGVSYSLCDKMAKQIPMFCSLDKALETVPEVRQIYNEDADAKKVFETARKLEGVARHSSRHACGILITRDKLTENAPLQYASNEDRTIVSQYSLHPVEDLGLLKMDFLGLKNLTIIDRTLKIIKRLYNLDIDIDKIPIDDKKTYELFQDGATTGIFQFESSGMRRYLKELGPTDIEDIIAMGALYRPGPMDLIPDYIAVKNGRKKPSYLHPLLKPILDKTYGIAIYQEQLLKIARDLAGFTLGEADVLRRAIGKKIVKLLNEQKIKFINGCVANKIKKETAEKIFAFMEPFAGYGFNRSHAACYAIISYQTAYLKANYPAEFMAALMTADYGNLDKIALEIEECARLGIEILPPDINESFRTFTVVKEEETLKQKIRFGLAAIKNLGENIIEVIKDERERNGKFKDLDDFAKRVDSKDFNKKSLESLIKSGSLDSFGQRGTLLANIDNILNYAKQAQKSKNEGQVSLFGDQEIFKLILKEAPPVSRRDELLWEKEFLGLYISGHPFKGVSAFLGNKILRLSNLPRAAEKSTVRVGGIITGAKKIITKNNESMLFLRLEDETGGSEVIIFPSVLKENPNIFAEDKMVIITGKISAKDAEKKIICEEIFEITSHNARDIKNSLVDLHFKLEEVKEHPEENEDEGGESIRTQNNRIKIRVANKDQLNLLKEVFTAHAGMDDIYLATGDKIVKTAYKINYNNAKAKLEEIAGKKNVENF